MYHPLPENGVWRVDYWFNTPAQWSCSIRHHFQYYIEGDTIINSQIHKCLYRSEVVTEVVTCDSLGMPPSPPIPGYVGALREDSIENRIYYVYPNTSEDSLLYDYNLNVGDSLQGSLVYWDGLPLNKPIVVSIDSVDVSGNLRRRWNLSPIEYPWGTITPYILESIGFSFGLIEPIVTVSLSLTDKNLVCVKSGEDVIYSSGYPSNYGCNFVSIPQVRSKTPDLTLYPNPSKGQFKIDSDLERFLSVEVYNIQGQIIYTESNLNSNSGVDLKGIKSGIYYVRFYNEQVNMLRQVVIQK